MCKTTIFDTFGPLGLEGVWSIGLWVQYWHKMFILNKTFNFCSEVRGSQTPKCGTLPRLGPLFGGWGWPPKWQNEFWTKKSKCAKIDVFGVFQKPHFFTFCSFLAQSFKNVMVAKNDPYLQNDQKCHFGVWPKIDFGLQGDSSHVAQIKLVSKRVLSFDICIYALLPKSPLFSVHLTTTFWGLLAVLKRGIRTKGRFSCF